MRTRDCIRWLWKASKGNRGKIAAISAAGILHVAVSMFFVVICKSLIDIATGVSDRALSWHIAGVAICLLLQVVLAAIETRISSLTDINFRNSLRHKLFSAIMTSRWEGKENFHSGDALNRVMDDVRIVTEALIRAVPSVIAAAIQFLAAFSILFVLEPGLAWCIPVLMTAMLLISRSYMKRMRKLTRDIRNKESRVQSLIQESFQHRILLHTLERTPDVEFSLDEHQKELRTHVMDKTDYSIFARAMIQIGFSAGYACAFLWGVFGIMSGSVTFGMMTAFLQLVGQIQRPILNLSRQISPLVNSVTSAERLSELTSLPSDTADDAVHLGSGVGVLFENVSYGYSDSNEAIFTEFTHDFHPGSTTALVGETGVGKSTLMRLILSLLHPDDGKIMMYNSDQVVEVSSKTRCNIVYVPQGNTLMSGTIRENLLLGDPDATDGDLEKVLHIAVADFVFDLPDGLDTICGERGSGLSEGQAQRIAIARALLRNGGLLLLDEPTASLDSHTEELLLERLSENLEGRTLIMVTHREMAADLCQETLRLA